MSSVASKNLFELLGNDPDEEPKPPVVPVEKPAARHGKRNENETPKDATSAPRGGGRGGRGRGRGDQAGSERAYQDREAGRSANRGKPVDDGLRVDRHSDRLGGGRIQRGGSYDGRGGRGGAGGRGGRGGKDDRHSRSLHSDSAKQAEHGWGGETGTAEWNDEKAGQAQAWEEEKEGYDAFPDKPVGAEGEAPAENGDAAEPQAEPEPEDKSMSYADYLAAQAEKKLALGGNLEARKPNEGASKKQPEGKAIQQSEETDFFVGGGGKKQRERERKEKATLVLDHDYAPRGEPTGGRGGRGGRGRGRGDRGDRGDFRGDRRGGGPRGGPGGGRGGGFRGGRGGATPNVTNASDFPTLGS